MRLACPHCHEELDVAESWAGQEVACPLCQGGLLVPAVPAASQRETNAARPGGTSKLQAWNRRRAVRRIIAWAAALALIAGASLGLNAWRGERPPAKALRDLGDHLADWLQTFWTPPAAPTPPAEADVPTATPTPQPLATPQPTPAPTPEAKVDAVAWLIANPARQPSTLTLREAASFPALYEGKVVGQVMVPSGTEVKLVGLDADLVELRFREGIRRLPHESTNLREIAAEKMAEPAPTPVPEIAASPVPTPPPPAPKTRGEQLGAVPQRDGRGRITGTKFRVWAPHAEHVSVIGSFNRWKPGADPMTGDSSTGIWSANVAGAKPGDEYLFLINGELEKRDPRGRELSASGKSVVHDPAAFDWQDTRPPAIRPEDLVIYQLHPGTFHDPDAGDGSMATLREATSRLDHLRDLGVNCVLLMPVQEFAGNHSWGYNPTDPYSIERAYGGPEALREFVREAHRRGIAVHVDVVHNHYNNEGVDLKRFDGYGGGENSHGIYFYEDAARGMTPWGPRPDFGRAEVRSYIADNIRMLFDEYRVDGLRWDSVVNILRYHDGAAQNPDGGKLLDEISAMIRTEYPGKISIAEDAVGDDRFDASWEYGFHHAGSDRELGVVPQLTRRPGQTDVTDVAARLQTDLGLARVIYTENHDETGRLNGRRRLVTDADESDPHSLVARRKSALAAVLTLTAPGIPMIFMGQELLEDAEFHDSNPLDWQRGQLSERSVRLFRDLIRLRRNLDGRGAALQGTKIRILEADPEAQFLAYRRYLPGRPEDDIIVLVNFSPAPVEDRQVVFPRSARWEMLVNTDDPQYGADFTGVAARLGGFENNRLDVHLAPFSAQIFGVSRGDRP